MARPQTPAVGIAILDRRVTALETVTGEIRDDVHDLKGQMGGVTEKVDLLIDLHRQDRQDRAAERAAERAERAQADAERHKTERTRMTSTTKVLVALLGVVSTVAVAYFANGGL